MLDGNNKKLWYYNSNRIERKRYQWQIPAAMMAVGVGASLFGKKKKKSQEDPLAPIRQQLMALSGQVPEMVARQKRLLGERYGTLREEGVRDIGENVYAERGLGRTSIYDRLRTELIDKLARSQAESELQTEMGGLELQSGILGRAGGLVTSEQPEVEEPSLTSKLLGAGASLIGQEYGMGRLEDILGRTSTTATTG